MKLSKLMKILGSPGSSYLLMNFWGDFVVSHPGSWMRKNSMRQRGSQGEEKTEGDGKELYLSLFLITPSHPHLQSIPPNLTNSALWQSICLRVLFRIRPSFERTSHSHITMVLHCLLGQRIEFHSLSLTSPRAFPLSMLDSLFPFLLSSMPI